MKYRSFLLGVSVLLVPAMLSAQERATISGRVTVDGSAQPLSGATVAIAALNLRSVTDDQGRYSLNAIPVGSHSLRVTRLGYRPSTRQVTLVAGGTTVDIAMGSDPLRLEEMVVTGYGEQRRRNLTGAIASLRPEETVKDVPLTSVMQALQGRMSGVQVVQNAGNPGNAITVRVRGSSSIQGGNDPLYVVDGVPVTQGNQGALGIGMGGQGIDAVSDLNPSEIESIEVLKDASAAAIYGSRASNGVVLITTKRGTANRPEVTFGSYYGMQKEPKRVDFLNATQYMEIYNEGLTARFGAASLPANGGYQDWYCYESTTSNCETEVPAGVDTDWLSLVLKEAPMANLEGAVRGGTERVRYYVAGSGVEQDGLIRNMGYSRLNGRVNLDYVPYSKLTLGTNVSLGRSVTNRHSSDNTIYSAWANAMANPPIEPVKNADGTWYNTLYSNPVAQLEVTANEERAVRILGNAFAQYNVMEGVTARVGAGLDQLNMNGRQWDSPVYGAWASSGGRGRAASRGVTKNTFEGTVNFNRLLQDKHEFSGVVGSSVETNTEADNYVQGTSFPTEFFKQVTSAATISTGSSTLVEWNLVSYFGRLSYTWNERVTTTFNVRRDGSSRFGTDNRFGTFPSASVLWRVGDESFMQSQSFVGNLALRASYGLTGNQQSLGNFASRGLFGGGSNYNDQPGISPSQLANPELKWEKTTQMNVGADFSVWDDRVAFAVDYYDKQTDDLLVQQPLPRSTGFSNIWSNVGSMENKGFEFSTTANIFRAQTQNGFNWTAVVNVSHNKNKVTELYNNTPIATGFAGRIEAGKPLGFFYGHVVEGIFQTQAEVAAHATQTVNANPLRATSAGDLKFKDLNGDGVINDNDRTMIGNPWPKYEGGITNNLSFRNFDLSTFVNYSLGNDMFNAFLIYGGQYGSGGDNHTVAAMNRWTPTNTNTKEPRAVWSDPNLNTRDSDRFIEDASFWRLKNIALGYTLPSSVSSRTLKARTARLYVQGQNLFTSTKYKGFDPEVNSGGNSSTSRGEDFYALPQPRTMTFGINLAY